MKHTLSALLILGASLSLNPAMAQEPPDAEAPVAEAPVAEAPAAADRFSAEVRAAIGPADANTGKVVFFRPNRFAGAAVGFKVREGGTELGKLRNGRFFSIDVAPGTHEYTVHSEAKDITTLEVEAGETYFVEGRMNMGFMVGRPNLTPSGVDAFEAALGKLKPAEPLSNDDDNDNDNDE
jgi:hypothetical protein